MTIDNDNPNLSGRTAVVTGASSGHGRAIALALADAGANLVCADLREQALPNGYEPDLEIPTHEVIRKAGGNAVFQQADVSKSADQDATAAAAVDSFGRVDVWVNNAGVFLGNFSAVDEPEDIWERTLRINLTGTWLGCKAAIRQMKQQETLGRSRGKIVNIGSIAGMIGQADLGSYSAAKGAVHNLTRALAIECAPDRINVNAIAPGYFPTAMNRAAFDDPDTFAKVQAMHPWPELGVPADVAAAVTFLGSPSSDWVTGAILPVDGGFTAT